MINFRSAINIIYASWLNSYVVLLVLLSLCIIIAIFYLGIKHKFNYLFIKGDLLHTLCSTVGDVYIIYDSINQRFEYISPNFETILGFSSTKLRKNMNALFDYVFPEKREECIEFFTSSKLNEYKELECEYRHPICQQLQRLAIRFYPVIKNNEIYRYITCIHENTKEYQTQIAMKEALQLSRNANEAKKEFLYHISHELKVPISGMIGITQIAMNSITDTNKVMHCLEKVNFSSYKIIALIDNILDMAKIDSDKLILINEPFSMLKVISEFSSFISSQAEINNIEYKLILQPAINDYLVGDSLRIIQIIGNCLSNSIKFTPSGGRVTLEIWELEYTALDSFYRFQVTDTGKGMDENYINRIFEPFNQENQTIGTKYGGCGLGMSIAKSLLDLMGGTIQVNSRVGEGTTVMIDIHLKVANTPISDTELSSPLPRIEYDFDGMCVLVVEDNEINLEIVTEHLKRVNVQVETATNGNTAIKRFEASKEGYYDMILMDVHMPDISGYEASRVIRSTNHPDAGQITIVAMTADNFVNDFSCIQSGINYHLSKPVDLNKLYLLLNTIWLRYD